MRVVLLVCVLAACASPPPTRIGQPAAPALPSEDYQVYTADGAPSSLEAVLAALDEADVLLIGELHDDRVGHAVELALLEGATARYDVESGESGRRRPVVLSLEMFERDVQHVVDEYLDSLITEDHFLRSSRPWDHYESRYRALVEHARADGIPVVAANAPRRYVNRVTRLGAEALLELSAEARSWLPPLPYPPASDAYRAEFEAVMAEAVAAVQAVDTTDAGAPTGAPAHSIENALQAQTLWDATMGYSIARALEAHPGGLVLHMAGSFHVKNGTGIPERISDYRPSARVVSVVMERERDVGAWNAEEHAGLGDFVVLTRNR